MRQPSNQARWIVGGDRRPGVSGWRPAVWALVLLALPAASFADCPPAGTSALLASLPLDSTSRTDVIGLAAPRELYRQALATPDLGFVERDGNQSQGAMLATVPIEAFWMALNDEDHHDEGGYLPLRESQVIAGEPGDGGRRTFQYFKKAGLGRWWVNRMDMNADLYAATDGRLWELVWEDVLEEYAGDEPPVEIDGSVPKVKGSVGAWLLVRLGEACTLIEYAAEGELGGVVGAFQWLAANRTLRSTMQGMLEMARNHLGEPHPAITFVRPDGSPLDDSPGS